MCGICGELRFDGQLPDLATLTRMSEKLARRDTDAGIDRPKGYFPVPALKHVRGILQSDACSQRGLYQCAYVDKLLAEPEAYFTRTQGSKLWHLAVLEWWLQLHVDGRAASHV